MGYGRKAMELLSRYYQGEMTSLDGDAEDDATAEQGLPLDTDFEGGLTEVRHASVCESRRHHWLTRVLGHATRVFAS